MLFSQIYNQIDCLEGCISGRIASFSYLINVLFYLDYKMAVALAVVPQQLGESVGAIWEVESGTEAYPQIRFFDPEDRDEKYSVTIDGLIICTSGDRVAASRAMIASYYVFNLTYPKGLANTLTFYQRVFLGLTYRCQAATQELLSSSVSCRRRSNYM